MDIVYLQDAQKFITIPNGDIATHEQILNFYHQREIEMQKQMNRSTYNNVCKYFEIN